jgi:hypothetical protein
MRYLPMILGAGLLSAGLLAGNGQAHAAMPALTLDHSAVVDSPVEKVYYYRRHYYGYRPYHRRYYRPMATTATATGPTVIMVTGVAGATKTGRTLKGASLMVSSMRYRPALTFYTSHS